MHGSFDKYDTQYGCKNTTNPSNEVSYIFAIHFQPTLFSQNTVTLLRMPLPISASEIRALYGGPLPFQISWYRGKYGLPSGTIKFSDFQRYQGCTAFPNNNPISCARNFESVTGQLFQGRTPFLFDFVAYLGPNASRTYESYSIPWFIPAGYSLQYQISDFDRGTSLLTQAGPFFGNLRMHARQVTGVSEQSGFSSFPVLTGYFKVL